MLHKFFPLVDGEEQQRVTVSGCFTSTRPSANYSTAKSENLAKKLMKFLKLNGLLSCTTHKQSAMHSASFGFRGQVLNPIKMATAAVVATAAGV